MLMTLGFSFLTVAHTLSEAQVLLQFKKGLNDSSGELSNWSPSDTLPCNWTGISCTTGGVTGISLANLDISGAMPAGLGTTTSSSVAFLHESALSGFPARSSIGSNQRVKRERVKRFFRLY